MHTFAICRCRRSLFFWSSFSYSSFFFVIVWFRFVGFNEGVYRFFFVAFFASVFLLFRANWICFVHVCATSQFFIQFLCDNAIGVNAYAHTDTSSDTDIDEDQTMITSFPFDFDENEWEEKFILFFRTEMESIPFWFTNRFDIHLCAFFFFVVDSVSSRISIGHFECEQFTLIMLINTEASSLNLNDTWFPHKNEKRMQHWRKYNSDDTKCEFVRIQFYFVFLSCPRSKLIHTN